jgi:transcriptional regulator with XRE-family HTH domain
MTVDLPPDGGLGAQLRQARERAGLELGDVAARTHVRKAYLEALENEDLQALPEDVYARNFLRLYARTVGLDPDEALERFAELRRRASGRATGVHRPETPGRATPPPASRAATAEPAPEGRPDRPRRTPPPPGARPGAALVRQVGPLLMTLVLAGVLVGTAVWGFNQLLFRPDRPAPAAAGEAQPGDAATADGEAGAPGADGAAPESGLAAPLLPGGQALPDEILLSVESEPPGAEVTVDAFPLPGTTPIREVPVTARPERTVRVTREGYLPYEASVDMSQDRTLTVTLEPEPGAAADAAGAQAPGEGVVVEVRETTWLEAYQSTARGEGERLVYTTAQPGERFVFSRPVYLHLGNAGGVQVTVDGEPIGPLGSGGAVTGQAFPAP